MNNKKSYLVLSVIILSLLIIGFNSEYIDAQVSSLEDVVWTNDVNVSITGNNLIKINTNGWNGGASSVQSLTGGDGFVQTIVTADTLGMIGLSNGDPDQDFRTINFGMHIRPVGFINIMENGVNVKSNAISYDVGDVLKVSVDSNVVTYLKNDVVFFTSLQAPVFPLLVDTSIKDIGDTLNAVTINFPNVESRLSIVENLITNIGIDITAINNNLNGLSGSIVGFVTSIAAIEENIVGMNSFMTGMDADMKDFTHPGYHYTYTISNSTVIPQGATSGSVLASCDNGMGVSMDTLTFEPEGGFFNTIPNMNTFGIENVDWSKSLIVIETADELVSGNLGFAGDPITAAGYDIDFLTGNASQDVTLEIGVRCVHNAAP